MEVRPGYKQTEVGVIPEDWGIRAVFEIAGYQKARFDDGDWIEAEHISDGGYRIVQTGNIGIGKLVEKEAKKYIYERSFEKLKCKELIPGDILICRLAEPAGRACILPNLAETKVVTAVDVTIFRPSEMVADRSYLVQYFSTPQWFESVLEQVGGTTHKRISRSALGNIKVPFPNDLDEQRAIATALSDMDALLNGLDRLIAKKRAIKQAAMQQLLTGQTRLPGFSGEWEVKRASDVGQFRGGSGFPVKFQGAISGTYPFFKVSDMNNDGNNTFMVSANNYINESIRKQIGSTVFPARTIVFAKVGAAVFLERKKILIKPSCIDNNMAGYIIDANQVDVRFIHYVLLQKKLGELVSTTALPSLGGNVLSAIELFLPELDEQTAIATVLCDMDTEITTLETRRTKTRALKQAMMQELLTGRTRLV